MSIILLHTEEGGPMDVLHHLKALAHKAVQEFGDDKDAIFRMVFDNDKLSGSIFELMGGKTRLHYEGCYVRAVRLL